MVSNGKRIAYGRNQNRVNETTYPDDTSVPVRTSHWNQDPHDQAILGFTKITATLDASGVIYTKDDTTTFVEADGNTYSKQSTLIEVECEGTETTDIISKIDITDTNENDIVYLFKATDSDAITISDITPSANGHIKTQLSGGATLVHDGVPIMLIRRGDYWYEFGADGAAGTPYTAPTIGSTSIASGSTNATIAGLTLTTPDIGTPSAGTLTDCDGLPAAGVVGTAAVLGANTFTDSQIISKTSTAFLLTLHRDDNTSGSGSPVGIVFNKDNLTGVEKQVANISSYWTDNSAEDGVLQFNTRLAGVGSVKMNIDSAGTCNHQGNDISGIQNLVHDLTSSTTVSGAQTLDFNADQLETWALSGSTAITFNTSSNKAVGRSKTIRLVNDATLQNLTLNASWKVVGAAPTDIAASKTGILTLTCFGTAETDIVAAYAVEA